MSAESILASLGMSAADVSRVAARCQRKPSVAALNEAKYNPNGDEDDPDDRFKDAEREADAFGTADFGMVSNSHWQMNTRIGG